MSETLLSPRNPYASFIVSASAGSGKTYQLSRRFLCLVAAGAEPSEILTVTFTRKAAGEMRARILQEASRLLSDSKAQAGFNLELASYYAQCGRQLTPPRSPTATARAVLEASQALKIMTIDSVFLEWVAKFTYEASGAASDDPTDDRLSLPTPFALLDPFEEDELDKSAWAAACAILARGIDAGNHSYRELLRELPKGSVLGARAALDRLGSSQTALWYEERRRGRAVSPHTLPNTVDDFAPESEEAAAALIDEITPALLAVIGATGNEELRLRATAAVQSSDYEALLATPLITKAGTISKTYVSAKRRAAVEDEAALVEDALRRFTNARRLTLLNRQGESVYTLYRMHRTALNYLKGSAGSIAFADLAQGAYRLFHHDAGLGVRFLLARTVRHLMLDEFQDTSRLQWSVFAALAAELTAGDDLAGPGELPGTAFIVGDAKQSIYGFREADPTVMGDAMVRFADRAKVATLSQSYRTAQVVLDFVNAAFAGGALPDFPHHSTARTESGDLVIPDVGRVILAPLLDDDPANLPDAQAGPQKEAALVADALAAALGLTGAGLACPVFDKDLNIFRPLAAGDCAVLYRSGSHAELFEDAFRARGIACHKEEQHGFFSRPEVRDVLSLARFLCIPADLPSLLVVLKSPFGCVSDETMLRFLADDRDLSPAERAQSLLSALQTATPHLVCILRHALAQVGREPLHAVLDAALLGLGAEAAYAHPDVNDQAEGSLAGQNIRRFLEICLALESGAALTPAALVAELERLARRNETGNAPVQGGSVTLMTIHKSKGLEFPLVALVDTARPWAQRDPYWVTAETPEGDGRTFYYVGTRDAAPTDDPAFELLQNTYERGTREECMRLLYVAMTRARQYLLITGHRPARSKGIEGTIFYDHLRTCLSTVRTPEVLSQFEVPLAALNSNPDPCAVPMSAMPSCPATETALLDGLVDEGLRAPPHLPAELEIVSPSSVHDDLSSSDGTAAFGGNFVVDTTVPADSAALFGTLVHEGLQAWLEGRPYDLALTWSTLSSEPDPPPWLSLVAAQIFNVQCDPIWNAWRSAGIRIDCELPLVQRRDDQLIQGAADAVVFTAVNEIQVIDFKTTLFVGNPSLEDLQAFCRRRGFAGQLSAYAQALRAIHPNSRVHAQIYFVALRRFLPLDV